jgi:hypothetical protein
MDEVKEQREIKVDGITAFQLKLLDFDYKIAESELVTTDLKKQKIHFVREAAIQDAIAKFDTKEI